MAKDTHKFESRYLDSLIGPYPERRDLYLERSPIHHLDRLSCPIIFFQGLEDQIVPPNQAEMMVDALRARSSCRSPTWPSRASSTASGRPRRSSGRWKQSCIFTRGSSALRWRTR